MLDENAFISIACNWPSMAPNRLHLPHVHRLAGGSADELQAEADWFEKAVDLYLTQILDARFWMKARTMVKQPSTEPRQKTRP